MKMQTATLALTLLTLALANEGVAAEWGNLKGRLVYDGSALTADPVNVNKDTEFCSKHDLVDETIVVGDEGGLQNVFVYLYLARGKSVEAHPDLKEPSADMLILDNKGCRFEPRAMTLRTGQTLEVRNSDSGIGHNTNATFIKNSDFNQLVPNDSPLVKVFDKSESFPSPVACNVHPWMKAHVLIRDNPYMAVTGEEGKFEIENLPEGKHEFIFWHESKGVLRSVKVGGTKTSRKGRAKLEIPAGDTLDLGEVKIPAKALGK